MGLDRYLGFHFTENCIFVAEAFIGRGGRIGWDILRQANYELPPEWLPLFQTGIPNFFDTENSLYGFAALPAIWRGFSWNRFIRFDFRFFETALKKGLSDESRTRLARLFRYCQVYHIHPQPDEQLHAVAVFERLNRTQCDEILDILKRQVSSEARISFVGTADTEEACLQYLWYEYEGAPETLELKDKRVLLVDLGYDRTIMTPWDKAETVEPNVQAPGMRQLDEAVARYAGRLGFGRTIGMDELMLYAQRARRAFVPGQSEASIVNRLIPSTEYVAVIREQANEIAVRLGEVTRPHARKHPLDEILLVGEGTAFSPIIDTLQAAHWNVPMRVLDEPVFAVAKGAAAYCWELINSKQEERQ